MASGRRSPAPAPHDDAPAEVDDAHLVARVREGDAAAFERLVRRYLPLARAVARDMVAGGDDADDVCQEAFLLALQRIDQCRHPERFRSWLMTIVRNCARAQHAGRRRTSAPMPEQHADPRAGDPSRDAFRAELRAAVFEALEDLTDLQRGVLVLHDVDGWRHRDIAAALGISPGSSRVHLHTARRLLRRALGPGYAEA